MYVSDKHLAARYGVTRPTIWRWVRENKGFPRPVSLSPGCTRWRVAEIEAWERLAFPKANASLSVDPDALG